MTIALGILLLILVFGIVLFIVSSTLIVSWGTIEFVIPILIIAIIVSIFVINNSKSSLPFFLKGGFIFSLSYIIVNFQVFLEKLYGNDSFAIEILNNGISINSQGFYLSLIGFVSFIIGYSADTNKISITSNEKFSSINHNLNLKFIYVLNYIILAVYILSLSNDYLNGGYSSDNMNALSVRYSLILELTYYSILYSIIKNQKSYERKSISHVFGYVYLISLLIYFSTLIFAGDRGPIIYLSLASIVTYISIIKLKVKNIYILLAGIIMIGATSIFGLGRKHGFGYTPLERIEMGFEDFVSNKDHTLSPATMELAGSAKCNFAAIEIVEENGFYHGQFLIQQIIGVIPFISSAYYDLFDIKPYEYNSANLITRHILGDYPTYGCGSSCVADLYLDFGIIGVVIGLIMFGILMKFVDENIGQMKNLSTFWLCTILVFYSKSYYIPRSYISFEFRFIIWLYLVIIVYSYLNKIFSRHEYIA